MRSHASKVVHSYFPPTDARRYQDGARSNANSTWRWAIQNRGACTTFGIPQPPAWMNLVSILLSLSLFSITSVGVAGGSPVATTRVSAWMHDARRCIAG